MTNPQLDFLVDRNVTPRASEDRKEWETLRQKLEKDRAKSNITQFYKRRSWPWFELLLQVFAVFLWLCGLYRRGKDNAARLEFKELEIDFPNVPPAFDGYRILHLTDFHFERMPGIEDRIGKMVASTKIDLVVMTGDYLDEKAADPSVIESQIAGLVRYLKPTDGILATLGNHDPAALVPILERHGIRVLINESVEISRGRTPLVVTGIDDVHYYYSSQVNRAMAAASEPGFKIVLVHSPEAYEMAAQNGYSLYLAGHTHGGQICFPSGKPVFTHIEKGRKFARGLWRHQQLVGYTNCGVGVSSLSVRYFCPPEVAVLTLRRRNFA